MGKLNQNEVAVRSNDESNAKRTLERYYLRMHVRDYIERNFMGHKSNAYICDSYKANIMTKVFNHVHEFITIPRLHCIFMANRFGGRDKNYRELNELKTNVLNYIDEVAKEPNELGDVASFRAHIENMHPIILDVVNYFTYDSGLFYDAESMEYIYPDIEYIEEQIMNSL